MTRSIVVGLALREDDAAPLSLARALARVTGAPLTLVTAYPRETRGMLNSPEYAIAVRRDVHGRLEAVAATLRAEHDVATFVRQGPAAQVLRDVADHYDAAAVVVGSTHRGTLGRVLMGDIAAGLLHGAPCPVVVAPRGYTAPAGGLRRNGVAFCHTPEARHALAHAAELALACGASVECCTVAEQPDWAAPAAVPGWAPPAALVETARAAARETARAALDELPPGIGATSEVLDGAPVAALAAISARLDLLVCGSRGYGAIRSVMAGGVSRGLAHEAACPLLVVPRGPAAGHSLLDRDDASAANSPIDAARA